MRRTLTFVFFGALILFMLACLTVNGNAPAAVNTPTELAVIIPYPNQTPRPALPTWTSAPAPIKSTPEIFPAWVAEFSDPILKSLAGKYPAYQDDFPAICIADDPEHPKQKVQVCSTPEVRLYYQDNMWSLPVTARPTLDLQPDLQNGYALLNTGWFYDAPDTNKNPHLAQIDSGALILKLPQGKINKDLQVYNPHLARRNFVLLFDIDFMTIEPTDTVRAQFNQSAEENFALDISRDKKWTFHWGAENNRQSLSGAYERFTPEHIAIVIIARGTTCAVYFNHDPLVYVEGCRSAALAQNSKKAVAFHLIGEPGYESIIAIDNVALWDLDSVP